MLSVILFYTLLSISIVDKRNRSNFVRKNNPQKLVCLLSLAEKIIGSVGGIFFFNYYYFLF
jgi:hypothetical protein